MAVASLAGVINVFMTSPIWVINTRLTLRTNNDSQQNAPSSGAQKNASGKFRNASTCDTIEEEKTAADTAQDTVRIELESLPGRSQGEAIAKNIKKYGIRAAFAQIMNEEGIQGLYKGLIPSLILVSNPATQFMVYEQLMALLAKWRSKKSGTSSSASSIEIFVVGAIAKAIATVVTYPYQVVKSRQQVDTSTAEKSLSMMELIRKMYKEEGFTTFFRGMGVKLSQTVTNAAVMFIIYEKVLLLVKKMILRVAIRTV